MGEVMVSNKPVRQVTAVRELLANAQARDQLAAVAASHMTPDRMMRLLALAIDKTPQIADCTPLSILGALMTCSSLGLEPNTTLGHAYIIPFKNNQRKITEAQLVIGYRGYIALAHNSGQIAGIDAGIHYSDDPHWLYRKGVNGVLEHEPGPEQGEKLHAYAVVNLANGHAVWVCWPWAKVIAHRDRYSQGYKNAVRKGKTDHPWMVHEDMMAMKTMIRQLSRFMPMSSEVVRAAEVDGARADYSSFAMNPAAGLVIEPGEGDDSEVYIEDDEGSAAAAEKMPMPGPDAPEGSGSGHAATSGQHAGAAALAEAREKAQAAAAKAKAAPAAEEKPAEAPKRDHKDMTALCDAIRRDLCDWPKDQKDDFDAMQEGILGQIKHYNPEQHAEIIAEVKAHFEG